MLRGIEKVSEQYASEATQIAVFQRVALWFAVEFSIRSDAAD